VTRGAGIPLAAWLAALAAAALIAAGARYTADLSAFLPRAPSPAQQLLVDQLREGAVGRVMLIAIEGADAGRRAELSRRLGEGLRADARFAYVANGSAGGAGRERELLLEHRYLLSPAVTPERFTAGGLREAIGETLDLVASSAGALAQALLARDPTGEASHLAAAQLSQGPRPAVQEGVWASRDGARAILLARTAASGADTDAQAEAMRAVRTVFEEAPARAGAREARLRLSGAGVFAVESRALIQREVARVAALGVLLVAALLALAYRSATALALGLAPVLTGALVGVAAVAAGFGVVHGITLGFGATLIGEAVDYAIYLFVQAGAAPGARSAWLAQFWPTIRLGVITSMVGFSALLLSGFPGLAQLGLYSVSGLAAAALFTRYALPHLLPGGFRVRDLSALGARIARLLPAAGRLRWVVAALCVAATVVLLAKRDTLWAADLSALSTVSAEDQAYDGRLRADLGAPDARYLVVTEGASEEEALLAAERAGAALAPLVAQGAIAGFDSPARYLPSRATQDARARALPDPKALRARLERALRGLPLRAARLEGFVADVAKVRAGERLERAELEGTALGVALESLLVRRGERWHALLPLRAPVAGPDALSIDGARVREALLGSGATFLDLKAEADALYAGYLGEAIALSAIGVAGVLLALMVALRSAARVGRVAAPLGAAVLVIAGLLAAVGQPLTLMHLVGFLLVVAVGSNYALFFERTAPGAEGAERVLASLALANATTVVGFGVLATSSVPVLHALGVSVACGTALALAFAALLSGARPAAR
jgi:predicted exporter